MERALILHQFKENQVEACLLDTHTRKQVGKSKIHTPYIVGFVDNITNEFQWFTGSDCMEKFINHLKT